MLNLFTISFNSNPFIQQHLPILQSLSIPWHWTICEGLSYHGKDRGGIQPDLQKQHQDFRSIDGSSDYLDEIEDDRVTIIRRPQIWPGKTEMCNAALEAMPPGRVIHQIDADEIWQAWQLKKIYQMFMRQPERESALYLCRYWCGPDRFIFEPGRTGNMLQYEWRRTWRQVEGGRFSRHEPPCYAHVRTGFNKTDFTHSETQDEDLIFDHKAWVLEEQVAFKAKYYGWPTLLENWKALQTAKLPAPARKYFPFSNDDAMIIRAP